MRFRAVGCFISGLILGCLVMPGWSWSSPREPVTTEESSNSDTPGVLIETDKDRYEVGEAVEVYVTNELDEVITTRDQRSFCTIVALEREAEKGEEWEEVRNCISGAPVREVTLEPGSRLTVRLEVDRAPLGELVPGRYRAALAYSHGGRFSLSDENSHVARSEPFLIESTGG